MNQVKHFRHPRLVLATGMGTNAVLFFVLKSFSFVLITFLQIVIGYDSIKSGAVFSVYAIAMAIFSLATPVILKGVSPRRGCQAGIVLLAFSRGKIGAGELLFPCQEILLIFPFRFFILGFQAKIK